MFATLDKYTRDICYLHPWVYPALPAAEWGNLQNLFKIYLHNLILSLSSDASLYQIPCEYQVLSTSSREGAVRSSSEPPPTAFPSRGWQEGREWDSSCTSKTPKPSCAVWRSHGAILVPSTNLDTFRRPAILTPPHHTPCLLLSEHPKSHQRSHLRKWSRRSKGPLRSCLWDGALVTSSWPHTLVLCC